MAKLTLSVEAEVVERAKRYAEVHGVSVSKLVENYLNAVASVPDDNDADAPISRSMLGMLKGFDVDVEDYKRYLVEKYR